MVAPPCPSDQAKVYGAVPPVGVAVNVANSPSQIVWFAPAETVGCGFTVSVTTLLPRQAQPVVPRRAKRLYCLVCVIAGGS